MKNIIINILAIVLSGVFSLTWGQQFDLMATGSIEKIAQSPNFSISENVITLYSVATIQPMSTINGDTMHVGRIQEATTSVSDHNTIVDNFALDQNYPNPFNMTTVIRYSLPEQSNVTIKVYDISGREISTVVEGVKIAGVHSVGFGNNRLASGTYIYRMIAQTNSGKQLVETKKMIVMK